MGVRRRAARAGCLLRAGLTISQQKDYRTHA
jgi:hypothetical protein